MPLPPTPPTDPCFALDHVLDIAIAVAPADWDALRYQTRMFEDLISEIQTGCLAQPFADIYSWFPAQVTVDGETHADVGVRKKGFLGSLSAEKPSLKLRFDKYVAGQTLGGAMERMTLNNGIQDDSKINTCLAYQIFADAGLPAPRCNFATVSVNGQKMGLYVHVEEIKPPFLERHFADPGGNLYEGAVSDFRPGWRGTLEKRTNEEAADWSDIDAVIAALQDPTPAGLEALGTIVDLDRFLSFWATEVLVGHWDGYVGNRNTCHFDRQPNSLIEFIPWGVDQVFSLEDAPIPLMISASPALCVGPRGHRPPSVPGRSRTRTLRQSGRKRSCCKAPTTWRPSCSSTPCPLSGPMQPKTRNGGASLFGSGAGQSRRTWRRIRRTGLGPWLRHPAPRPVRLPRETELRVNGNSVKWNCTLQRLGDPTKASIPLGREREQSRIFG